MNEAEREDRGSKKPKPVTSKKPPLAPVVPKPKNPDRMRMKKADAIKDNERMEARKLAQKKAAQEFDEKYGVERDKVAESPEPVKEAPPIMETVPKAKKETPAQVRDKKKKQ